VVALAQKIPRIEKCLSHIFRETFRAEIHRR
jgi:hypothetical protein